MGRRTQSRRLAALIPPLIPAFIARIMDRRRSAYNPLPDDSDDEALAAAQPPEIVLPAEKADATGDFGAIGDFENAFYCPDTVTDFIHMPRTRTGDVRTERDHHLRSRCSG